IESACGAYPTGLRDSKLLSAAARERLIDPLRGWVSDYAVGEASAREIDQLGLTSALRLAGRRALTTLSITPELIILDGSHDWLSIATESLFDASYPVAEVAPVRTRVKADLTCASVAAASVFAKVHRDQLVSEMARRVPGYDLENNKGYATATHRAALRLLGPSEFHRISWKLPSRVAD
ncbi:MAG: ribonuclease HII, partial [Acidimicrobiaceae bacterium]|nr:ribonuclease HII [Acidimicrobiaceae bacterium]